MTKTEDLYWYKISYINKEGYEDIAVSGKLALPKGMTLPQLRKMFTDKIIVNGKLAKVVIEPDEPILFIVKSED